MKKLISLVVMVLVLNGCGEDKKFTYGSRDNTETMIGLGHANDVDIDINYMKVSEDEDQLKIVLLEANNTSENHNGLIFNTDNLPNLASAIKAAADNTRRFSVQQYSSRIWECSEFSDSCLSDGGFAVRVARMPTKDSRSQNVAILGSYSSNDKRISIVFPTSKQAILFADKLLEANKLFD